MKTFIILTAVLLSTAALADRVKFEKLTPADGPCLYLLDENTGEPTGNAVNPPCTEDAAQIDPPSLDLDAGPTTEFTVIPSRIEVKLKKASRVTQQQELLTTQKNRQKMQGKRKTGLATILTQATQKHKITIQVAATDAARGLLIITQPVQIVVAG